MAGYDIGRRKTLGGAGARGRRGSGRMTARYARSWRPCPRLRLAGAGRRAPLHGDGSWRVRFPLAGSRPAVRSRRPLHQGCHVQGAILLRELPKLNAATLAGWAVLRGPRQVTTGALTALLGAYFAGPCPRRLNGTCRAPTSNARARSVPLKVEGGLVGDPLPLHGARCAVLLPSGRISTAADVARIGGFLKSLPEVTPC